MLNTLFDERRRKEIHGAILSGRPIEFRRREPKADGMASYKYSSETNQGVFEGVLPIGTYIRVGAYEFVYNGLSIERGRIVICIRPENGLAQTRSLPAGDETAIDFPEDGARMRITPKGCGNDVMQATIITEPIHAEKD